NLKALDQKIADRTAALGTPSARWEERTRAALARAPQAHVLPLEEFASAEGATHRALDDHSVLLLDEPPDTDEYTFTVRTKLAGITAFKLEALTDEALPGGGPGRGDAKRPNFVLNEFIVESAPAGSDQFTPVEFTKATADHAQKNFGPARAIDGDLESGCGIF